MADISGGVFSCKSISEIIRFIRAVSTRRQPVSFGVNKVGLVGAKLQNATSDFFELYLSKNHSSVKWFP